MDVTYPADSDAFRQKMSSFLEEHLPEGWEGFGALPEDEQHTWQKQWRETLAEHNMLAPNWPKEYGGAGLTNLEHVIMNEEFSRLGVPTMGGNDGFSISMVGNTILHWGTEEQKKHYIPRILDGTDVWCQGYSEPNSGSDLANLGCKADLDGDEWNLNGQKIWTSSGMHGNYIFTLCRTAPEEAKHKGISFLLVPMDQPGVEVRPIKNIVGKEHFCEVFFSDAKCPKENVLGGVNNGWAVANTLLGFERGVRATVLSLPFRAELDNFVEMARERGKLDDPKVRQQIASFHTTVEIMRWQGYQTLTRRLRGDTPGPESSITKLLWSKYHQEVTEAAMDLAGADGMVGFGEGIVNNLGAPPIGTPNTVPNWMDSFFIARPGTIYAGTSEVQKNIVGERVLGLPKEPRADSGSWKESQAAYK